VKSHCSENPNTFNSPYFQETKTVTIPAALRRESNMQSQFTNVEQKLLSQLKCPLCMEYMKPPITFCVNGHNICNTCKKEVPDCPTCEQQFLDARNFALENLAAEAKYPCVYRKYGCTEICKLVSIGGHQEKCRYIPQPCPVNKLNLGACTWTGISSNMKSHVMELHKNLCLEYFSAGSLYNRGPIQFSGFKPTTKYCKLISAYNDVFCSCSEIKNDIFYFVLQYIGPAADAAKYKYKLEFSNKDRTENLAVTLLAGSFNEVRNSGNCMKLYPDQYNRFANDRIGLTFSLDIFKVAGDVTYR
jgi:E3 ubiquitin-protein ligase SIAH1